MPTEDRRFSKNILSSSWLTRAPALPHAREPHTDGAGRTKLGGEGRSRTHGYGHPEGGTCMTSHRFLMRTWWVGLFLLVCLSLPALAQPAPQSDAALARQGALALAAVHGETPRYGGKFLSV